MNKIIVYITVLAGILLLGACNLNEYPKFDDADAFVAFYGASFSVNEFEVDENNDTIIPTLRVPVRLTSLSGLPSTVGFEVIDGTAVAGRDFALKGGASVLNFDGNDPVRYIEFDVLPHIGEFTGDRVFSIALTSSGDVNMGGNDTVSVTILDQDHPLSAMLGKYTAVGTSLFNGPQSWVVTIDKDPDGDVGKVWITNFVVGGSSPSTPLYGLVDEDMTELMIPVGQTIALSSSFPSLLLSGFYGPDGEEPESEDYIPTGGNVTGIIEPGKITIQEWYGTEAFYEDGSSPGWFNILHPGVVLTKN
ncbi:MAG: hypothetical protein QM237_08260 [Bacteroidota bacterium]|jgi:hypothetical protein|nr:hypothetical protein [Bacteroidota bacterium]HHU97477.1 hypothetical protein [Petrimonas sp.]